MDIDLEKIVADSKMMDNSQARYHSLENLIRVARNSTKSGSAISALNALKDLQEKTEKSKESILYIRQKLADTKKWYEFLGSDLGEETGIPSAGIHDYARDMISIHDIDQILGDEIGETYRQIRLLNELEDDVFSYSSDKEFLDTLYAFQTRNLFNRYFNVMLRGIGNIEGLIGKIKDRIELGMKKCQR